MSMSQLVGMLEAIEFKKPSATSDKALNTMYDNAQEFHKLVTGIRERVPIYEIRMIINEETGDTLLAPVDEAGNLRTSWEGVDQTVQATGYVTELVTQAALLATDLVVNSVQIGIDAAAQKTPKFLGGPSPDSTERFEANKQIAKFSKAPHLIQMALKNQSRLMTHYRRMREEQGVDAGPIKSMPGEDLSTDKIISMSSDDINAWLEKENSGGV